MPGQFEVYAGLLGHLRGLQLLDACLTRGKSVSLYSKDEPRVKCWLTVRIICRIHGLMHGCFLNPCLHITVMTARKACS